MAIKEEVEQLKKEFKKLNQELLKKSQKNNQCNRWLIYVSLVSALVSVINLLVIAFKN